jgi:tetratricopeptide (TPR) repeat protein
MGHLYRAQGKHDQAAVAYQQAANLRPTEDAPHYFLGETYQALGNLEQAEAEYRLAAQIDPLESLPLLALGRMQWGQGKHEDALASFRAAVEMTPGWGKAHMALGNALLALGNKSEASEHYQMAKFVDGSISEGVVYDFAANLIEATIEAPGVEYIHGDYFTIGDEQKRVLFMHPNARAEYVVDLTGFQNLSALDLKFDIAMSPQSWMQEGDGVSFSILFENDQGTQQIFSKYINPKQNLADQCWHVQSIDISAYIGQTITLIFETDAGPDEDLRFDWAGWGEPRLLIP